METVTQNKKVLSFSEACSHTGFAPSYMYKLTSSNKIPYSKPLGGKIFFDREKLDTFLLSNPVKTTSEIEAAASTHVTTRKQKATA